MSNPSPKKSEKIEYENSYEMKDMATSLWSTPTIGDHPRNNNLLHHKKMNI
jgi:hypothetical protein